MFAVKRTNHYGLEELTRASSLRHLARRVPPPTSRSGSSLSYAGRESSSSDEAARRVRWALSFFIVSEEVGELFWSVDYLFPAERASEILENVCLDNGRAKRCTSWAFAPWLQKSIFSTIVFLGAEMPRLSEYDCICKMRSKKKNVADPL